MTKDDVESYIRKEAARILGIGAAELQPEMNWIDDLEADSLDLTELAAEIERKLDIRVGDADLLSLRTVKETYDFVWERMQKGSE